jgi:hypothetical protein
VIPDAALSDFVEHLIPEAFETPTRARRVHREQPHYGDDGFGSWVADRVAEALAARWPTGDPPGVVAYLSDGRLRWTYDDCGCGYLECVTTVIGDEAVGVTEPWIFGAVLPRPDGRWETIEDELGHELDEVWQEPVTSVWPAVWYAEARGRGAADTRAGFLQLDGEEVRSHTDLDVAATPATRQLHRVLFRHPSRRAHPLRRSRRRRG